MIRRMIDYMVHVRNSRAHPKGYSHGMPGSGRRDLEDVHGLVQQLFGDGRERTPESAKHSG
jgi:hypothetical protein